MKAKIIDEITARLVVAATVSEMDNTTGQIRQDLQDLHDRANKQVEKAEAKKREK